MAVKNFLMISIDDMRTVSNWAHFTPLIRTPHMDRLAEMGTTFERAVTQVPLCNPARTSVLSGLQPSETGVLDNQMPWYERVDPADTLPGVQRDLCKLLRSVIQLGEADRRGRCGGRRDS